MKIMFSKYWEQQQKEHIDELNIEAHWQLDRMLDLKRDLEELLQYMDDDINHCRNTIDMYDEPFVCDVDDYLRELKNIAERT